MLCNFNIPMTAYIFLYFAVVFGTLHGGSFWDNRIPHSTLSTFSGEVDERPLRVGFVLRLPW